ncbi:class Ib ribonucleoside-diphosphate reductase assembly flavoprotein NrdI [Liquorilactobacillus capillatus]|uniref:NrdI family protein n=1 Tax=Liquorilactobacillus capillatus DSM 19910 TaxID=1423731 RepID=A0A0R1LXB7_9LACO|nr:class Ib ribonucleoside-diphosphate reductase assembly flavoprotein NrdI [Liquorilactobacillus capillatus]KRL00224.1 NrdI family protein [Liquorilactobacillus capillatus DSM 19910]
MTDSKQKDPLRILFISIEGNTRSFIHKLAEYAEEAHQHDESVRLIEATEVSDASGEIVMKDPFVTFVPTYLSGGNGIHNGFTEILTEELHLTLEDDDNYKNCYGVVGSGNKNFNAQYGLTAKHYAHKFNLPLIDLYELRGTSADVKRVYERLVIYQTEFEKKLAGLRD